MDREPLADLPVRRKIGVRIAGLSTVAMIAKAVEDALRRKAFEPSVSKADFGSIVADLVSPPDDKVEVLLVVLDEGGLPARDWRRSADDARAQFDAWLDMLSGAMDRFAARSGALLLVNTVPQPMLPLVGHLDSVHPDGLSYRIAALNRRLRELAAARNSLRLIESDVALAALAPARRSDPKLWFYGRIPFSSAADAALAEAFAQAIETRALPKPKVLALDLDDTLWRGIFGDAGTLGVECGDDFPGNAFKALQQECLRLKSQGVLLTILSKNDPGVLEVFDRHPGMLLRRSDFVATRINWAPKADNARELAAEVGVGLDTFLFIDDSPHEREAMRQLAPSVRVLDVPADPALRPGALRAYSQLWPLRLTEEDAARSEMYAARVDAQKARAGASNVAEYLASLSQKLVVEPVTEAGVARLAQMHERTNQFNLTTRRYAQSDLATMLAEPQSHLLLQGRVTDCFGDHGVVICATAQIAGNTARLNSFLMSCRVIAREVEFAFLGALIEALVARGVACVEAQFIPTARNSPAADFLGKAGFSRSIDAGEAGDVWAWRAGAPVPGSGVVEICPP